MATVDEVVSRCWINGMPLRQTVKAVEVLAGEKIDFEAVRLMFVAAGEAFSGGRRCPCCGHLIARPQPQRRSPSG